MNQIVSSSDDVGSFQDDIVVHAENTELHDERFVKFF